MPTLEQDLGDRDAGRAGTGDHHAGRLRVAAGQPESVGQCGQRDDRGAVLVVVEDRDVEQRLEPVLDLEAAGRGDVLEVDPAEAGRQPGDGLDDLLGVRGRQADRDGVDAAELLEQDGLALHHRHRRGRADVTQAEHRGAVGDDRHGVGHPRVVTGHAGVRGDRLADAGNARRVRHREVVRARRARPWSGPPSCRRRAGRRRGLRPRGWPAVVLSLSDSLLHPSSLACGEARPGTGPRPTRPRPVRRRGVASRRRRPASSLSSHHPGPPPGVVRRSTARFTATVPSANRATTTSPGRTSRR